MTSDPDTTDERRADGDGHLIRNEWLNCCDHCGCIDRKGHDDTCRYGCNDDESRSTPAPVTAQGDAGEDTAQLVQKSRDMARYAQQVFQNIGDALDKTLVRHGVEAAPAPAPVAEDAVEGLGAIIGTPEDLWTNTARRVLAAGYLSPAQVAERERAAWEMGYSKCSDDFERHGNGYLVPADPLKTNPFGGGDLR